MTSLTNDVNHIINAENTTTMTEMILNIKTCNVSSDHTNSSCWTDARADLDSVCLQLPAVWLNMWRAAVWTCTNADMKL